MKRLFLTLLLTITSFTNLSNVKADYVLADYQIILDEINEEHNTSFRFITEEEYVYYEDNFGYNYDTYIQTILNASLDEFRQSCLDSIITNNVLYVTLNPSNARSVYETQAILFNDGANRLKMTYYYIKTNDVKYFDRSYTPTATVTKVKNVDFFTMNTYTVLFLNNNTELRVDLYGSIHTSYGVVNNQTFTAYFDLV